MKKIIYKYNQNDDIGDSVLKYILCILLLKKFNLEYVYEDIIQEIEEYKFIRGFDHFGDDIGSVLQTSYHDIREYVDLKDEVLGFNTLGFLKSKINLNKLVTNQWINYNNLQGLFVKNVNKITRNNFENMYIGNYEFFNLKLIDNFIHKEILNNKEEIINYINTNKNDNFIRIGKNEKIKVDSVLINEINQEKIYDIVFNLHNFDNNDKIQKIIELDIIKSNHKVCIIIKNDLDKTKFENFFNDQNISFVIESNDDITNFNIMLNCYILIGNYDKELWVSSFLSSRINKCYILDYKDTYIKPIFNTFYI